MTPASEVMEAIYPPPKWCVHGLIPSGLTLLTSARKVGKSWLVLQIAAGIARGEVVCEQWECEQGRVLYCGLEDVSRRMQGRLRKLAVDDIVGANMDFVWKSLRDGDQGIGDISAHLREHKNEYQMVIVDTLQKQRGF